MRPRLTLGYRRALAATGSALFEPGDSIRAHEFHHSEVTPGAGATPAWSVEGRAAEGFVTGSVHASYLHTHWAAHPRVAARLVTAARTGHGEDRTTTTKEG